MKKLLLVIMTLTFILIGACGCVKRDSMEDIEIITSSYPIEYLVNAIYGEHATIENIFPDGENIDTYKFNNKQYNRFSDKDLFIYNGKNASDVALELINRNSNLLLIDSTLGMEYTNGIEETWLDPSNLLMMALNIKKGLEEYVSNAILIKEIDEKYRDLKISLSELDADIKLAVENSDDSTIVVTNESLRFLEKYGFEVIVLNDNTLDRTFEEVRNLAKSGTITYVYAFEEDHIGDRVEKFISSANLTKFFLYRLDSINDDQRNDSSDYINIMNDNLDLLKREIYNQN